MALPPILSERLRLPIVAAPLFIISTPDLVIAQCKAGIVGSFPALNARPAAELDRWLERITTGLAEYDVANPDKPSAPFAVNQIVHGSNDRLQHDVEMYFRDVEEYGEDRPFEQWNEVSRKDAFIRGYAVGQWEPEYYTDEQKSVIDTMMGLIKAEK